MNLDKLKTELNTFSSDRDWDQFHSMKNLAMALSVECAELVEIFQWLTEEESNTLTNEPEKMSQLTDEVADIFLYLLRITFKANINIEEALYQKMEKNALKYPVHLSKGKAKKYDEL